MNSNVNRENSIVQDIVRQESSRPMILSPFFCSIVAGFGVLGGISALFIGLLCVLIHSLFPTETAFDTVATFLLIAAIPMILVGAIFLDEVEGKK